DTSAPKGEIGTLLLDPSDLTITTNADGGGSYVITGGLEYWSATATTSTLNNGNVAVQWAANNLVISTETTNQPTAPNGGLISWNADVGVDTTNSITINAETSIDITNRIQNTGTGPIVFQSLGNFLNYTTGKNSTAVRGIYLHGNGTAIVQTTSGAIT